MNAQEGAVSHDADEGKSAVDPQPSQGATGASVAPPGKCWKKTSGSGSRASFSLKHQMSDADSKSLFSYRPGAFKKAVDACCGSVVVPEIDGKPSGEWLLTEIDHWNLEREKLVILTEYSLLLVKYDFIKLAVCETKRIRLSSVHKIQIGDLTYPKGSLMQARDCGGVRIHFGAESQMGLRQRWNPWNKEIPYCTFIHHPLIYNRNENEKDTLFYNVDHMIETVKNGIDAALRREGMKQDLTVDEGPVLVETYAGALSVIFNQSHAGFFKVRGHVSF